MSVITFEILFIVLLLTANGVFAMSELAVVTSRKTRLQRIAAATLSNLFLSLKSGERAADALSTAALYISSAGLLLPCRSARGWFEQTRKSAASAGL